MIVMGKGYHLVVARLLCVEGFIDKINFVEVDKSTYVVT
jgi:hypothetical protein